MTFLDGQVIIDMIAGVTDVVQAVEERGPPYLTSAIGVFEVVDGRAGSKETDVVEVRQQFDGVRAQELNEQIVLEASRMQDRLMDDGERMEARDPLIATTARSTGDELIVADSDFATSLLTEMMAVANLRHEG